MKVNVCVLGVLVAATAMVAACEPTGTGDATTPPPGGSLESPLCGIAGQEILLLFDTSARMGEASGYSLGGNPVSRQALVVDALKRTVPHLKPRVDFGLLTFPFGNRRDFDGRVLAPAPDACNVGDVQVAPGEPYGWIVSQMESVAVGGKASVAGALDQARAWFGGHPAAGRARSVVLFTAGGDACGGDMLAAVDALAADGVPTWVLSFANSADAALLNLAADRGGRALKQPGSPYRYNLLTPETSAGTLQTIVEAVYKELCDGLDNDCDGRTDEDFDADGDGWSTCNQDCDDGNPDRYPGAREGGREAPYAAARVSGWFQGQAAGGHPIDPEVSNVAEALDHDVAEGRGRAFALGFNGYVEVEFDCVLRNGLGADLSIYERSPVDGAATETAVVYGWDVTTKAWVLLGQASNAVESRATDVRTDFDLGVLSRVTRIRVVNSTPEAGAEDGADGFDVNGIYALQDCGDCDGVDNDCSGAADEVYDVGDACLLGMGACQTRGIRECTPDGMEAVCDAPVVLPVAETCNGADDDCDGVVDDGLAVTCSTPCGAGHIACVAGTLGSCVVDAPNPEMCNGQDDNCDGHIDEGFDVGETCTEGMNACARAGVMTCTPDGLESECVLDDDTMVQGSAETCNGMDDDCDGLADEGKGLCPSGQVCFKAQCVYD